MFPWGDWGAQQAFRREYSLLSAVTLPRTVQTQQPLSSSILKNVNSYGVIKDVHFFTATSGLP